MNNYFQNIFPKISGSQEDNKISIFGCPHSFSGRRGHANFATLWPIVFCLLHVYIFAVTLNTPPRLFKFNMT